jgi:hypothetical protein
MRLVPAMLVMAVVACSPCRTVAHRDIALTCDSNAVFEGEIHVDSPGALTTFLATECSADDAAIDAAVAAIDFTTEAAFFVRGLRATASGCVDRSVSSTEVCADGLRVGFDDRANTSGACPGHWNVLLALPRDELRAAIGP